MCSSFSKLFQIPSYILRSNIFWKRDFYAINSEVQYLTDLFLQGVKYKISPDIFQEDAFFFVLATERIISVIGVIQAILVDRLEMSRPLIRGCIEASQAILITHHGNPYNAVGRFTLAIKHFTTPANKKTQQFHHRDQ